MILSKVSDGELITEYSKRFTLKSGEQVTGSTDVVNHLKQFFIDDLHREKFVVVFLSGNNSIITTETLFKGTLTSSAVYPREVIRKVLEHGAGALILSHNHPSGNLNPSKDDIAITKRLVDACRTIDVKIHDHIIIAGDGYTSFADKGLM